MHTFDPMQAAQTRLLADLARCTRLVESFSARPAPQHDSGDVRRLRDGRARREAIRKATLTQLHSLSVQLECAVENGRVLDAAEIRDAMQIAVEGLKSLGGAR